MVSASKIRGQSIRNLDRRERLETNLVLALCLLTILFLTNNLFQANTNGSLEAYQQYIGYERRAKHPDIFVTRGIYERAISEAARRRFSGEPGAEEALRMFWTSYCDALVSNIYCIPNNCQSIL